MTFKELPADDLNTTPKFINSLIDLHESFKKAKEADCVLSINYIPANEPLTIFVAKRRILKINIPEKCWRR